MSTDQDYYADALKRVQVAHELATELLCTCPDGQLDPMNARNNSAARMALRTAVELIEMNRPKDWTADYLQGHWTGLIEAAMRIIFAVELQMYDPRSFPERYSS